MEINTERFTLLVRLIRNSSIPSHDGNVPIQVKFSKRFTKRNKLNSENYWNGARISYIKVLREAHRVKYGKPSGLKETKEFLATLEDE